MTKHASKAIRVALEEIDRNPGEYKTSEEQKPMLLGLIEKHKLKHKKSSFLGLDPPTELTLDQYRALLQGVARCHTNEPGSKLYYQQLFKKGSKYLKQEYLQKNIFSGQDKVANSEEVEDTDDEQETSSNGNYNSREVSETVNSRSIEPGEDGRTARPQSISKSSSASYNPSDAQSEQRKTTPPKATPSRKRNATNAVPPSVATGEKRKQPVNREVEQGPERVSVKRRQVDVRRESTHQDGTAQPEKVARIAVKLTKLSPPEITTRMANIWSDLQTYGVQLAKCVTARNYALWVRYPDDELEKLYKRLFGADWRNIATDLISSGEMDIEDVLKACTAAGVHEMVFEKQLPWEGPEALISSLGKEEGYMDAISKELGLNLRTHVWQAAQYKVLQREFQEIEIHPKAGALAGLFKMIIGPQLKVLGIGQCPKDANSAFAWWQQRTKELKSVFGKALILKGVLRAAPDYYQFTWIANGTTLERESMEEVHPSTGDQVVKWCVTPLIESRPKKEGEWHLVCPAKVFSRPATKKQNNTAEEKPQASRTGSRRT